MTRVGHIFRKDVRRLWIEICLSLIAVAVLTRFEWWLCTPARDPKWYNEVAPVAVLFFCWWFLIVRLVHGEALVGDRQFWITRPYVWYELLAAKVLFVSVFICVPVAISQVVLVITNRSPIIPHLGGIASDVFGLLVVGVLPILALAAVTRNIPQWLAGALVVVLVIVGLAWMDSYIPNSHVSTGEDLSENLQTVSFLCLATAAVVVQYSRRNTLLSSVLLAVAVLSVPLIMVATPYKAIISRNYPLPAPGDSGIKVRFIPPETPVSGAPDLSDPKKITLSFSIEVSIPSDQVLAELNGVMLSIDSPNGPWQSEWQPSYQGVLGGTKKINVNLEMDRASYDRFSSGEMQAKLSLAWTQLKDRSGQRIVLARRFDIPGVGPCWIDREQYAIECRSTAQGPYYLLMTSFGRESTCTKKRDDDSSPPEVMRSMNTNSADGPLSPLALRTFYMRDWSAEWMQHVCLGTPVTFSSPELTRRFRSDEPLGKIRLSDYALRPITISLR